MLMTARCPLLPILNQSLENSRISAGLRPSTPTLSPSKSNSANATTLPWMLRKNLYSKAKCGYYVARAHLFPHKETANAYQSSGIISFFDYCIILPVISIPLVFAEGVSYPADKGYTLVRKYYCLSAMSVQQAPYLPPCTGVYLP